MPVLIYNPIVRMDVPVAVMGNYALASRGGVATASDTYSGNYPPSGANNGDRKGVGWGTGGGWNSVGLPSWLEIAFDRGKFVKRIDVFHIQDNYANPVEPDLAMTFSLYGNVNFNIEYFANYPVEAWTPIPGCNVVGNNKVWRQFIFPPFATSKIRVNVTGNTGIDTYARIAELEVWGSAVIKE